MIEKDKQSSTPRIKIIQKLYSNLLNPDEKIFFPKSQYKKFMKDVVTGTLERKELIEETILKHLKNDINLKKTDKILKIIIFAAVFELIFKHNNPKLYPEVQKKKEEMQNRDSRLRSLFTRS